MKKINSPLAFVLLTTLGILWGGTGCSSNYSSNTAAIHQKNSIELIQLEKSNKADQQLITSALKALQKEDKAEIIAKKKAWIAIRKQQLAKKKQRLIQLRKQRIAKLKEKNKQLATRKRKNSQKRFSNTPAIRKVAWRTNQPYKLNGDFANNASAHAFIKEMSRSHDMDSNYLNKIFSQAKNLKYVRSPIVKKPKSRQKNTHGRMGRWTRYRKYFITSRHINGGVKFWREHATTLDKAYRQYGIPPEYIVGILGVETIYGGNVGKTRVLDSLSTKAFHKGRRRAFFRNELEKFLLMAQSEGLNPVSLMGSSAGAVGLCQFMPSNFKTLGVDYNRNGSCNLWDPVDAIGSVANYFSKHGWIRGAPVVVRASTKGNHYKKIRSGYKRKHSLSRLANKGIKPHGRIDSTVRFLRMNTNYGDEVWLGGHNFYVITRYNHSGMYALAVHQLAQEVKQRYQGKIKLARR